jgi:hypothetical protein
MRAKFLLDQVKLPAGSKVIGAGGWSWVVWEPGDEQVGGWSRERPIKMKSSARIAEHRWKSQKVHHDSREGHEVRPHTNGRAKPSAISTTPTSRPRDFRMAHERP